MKADDPARFMHDYHRKCGRHSGIPECCINWYINSWSTIVANVPVLWRAYWDYNNTEDAGYIRCSACIENSIVVELKECDCEAR